MVCSQAVTALLTAFASTMITKSGHPRWYRQLLLGYLVQFESLLSTSGDEMGMLEDMAVGVENLSRVSIVLCHHPTKEVYEPHIVGGREEITIFLNVSQKTFLQLPPALQAGKPVRIIAVLFSQVHSGANAKEDEIERRLLLYLQTAHSTAALLWFFFCF